MLIAPDKVGDILSGISVIAIPASLKRVQVEAAQNPDTKRDGFVLRIGFGMSNFLDD
jgi:hypothetical protein